MTGDGARRSRWPLLLGAVLLAAAAARFPGVVLRSIWYDETITLLETSNGPTDWPDAPRSASELRAAFEGTPSLPQVTERLRETDVHPPVYYWTLAAWRAALGRSIETARLLSLLLSVASVAVFWGLLRRVGVEDPLLPAAAYALSIYAVHYGHEARGYALAILLLLGGFAIAIAAVRSAEPTARRAWGMSAASAALFAVAFLTTYLTALWSAAFLVWLVVIAGHRARRHALVIAIASPALAASGLFGLRLQHQFGARPGQEVGFRGILTEALHIAKSLTEVLCGSPSLVPWGLTLLLLLVLAGSTLWLARPGGAAPSWERRFTALAAALVLAPAAGFYAIDFLADRHLASARYLMFSGPALAFLATRGATRASGRLRIGALALVGILFALLAAGDNWNRADCRTGRSFAPYRSVVRQFRADPGASVLAVVGAGHGRGDLWSWNHELPDGISVLFLASEEDAATVAAQAERFSEVWILGATDLVTREAEDALRESLLASGWQATPGEAWDGAFRMRKVRSNR